MGKYKVIAKEVQLNDFRRRCCSCCGNLLQVDSTNGRNMDGKAYVKILTCQGCNLTYFFNLSKEKTKYLIDRVCIDGISNNIDAIISYGDSIKDFGLNVSQRDGEKEFNVFIRIFNSQGCTSNVVFFIKTYSLPKKKLVNTIKEKMELFGVFQ